MPGWMQAKPRFSARMSRYDGSISVDCRNKVLRHLIARPKLSIKKALDLEESIFLYVGADALDYLGKAQEISSALQRKDNPFSDLVYDQLVRLSPAELAKGTAAANVDVQAAFLERRQRQLLNDAKSAALNCNQGVLQCAACKSFRIDLTQRQSRSADEGMDTYCRCADCHKTWKMT